MRKRLLQVIFTLNWLLISGCQFQETPMKPGSDQELPSKFLSLDGIWVSTPDTALDKPASNWITAMMIHGSTGPKPTVRACFMWEGSFYSDWEIMEVKIDDSGRQLSILDADEDKFIGQADKEMHILRGFFYSKDSEFTDPIDTVDFVRADEKLASTLFYPLVPGTDGRMTYTYRVPESIDDQLETASIFEYTRDSSSVFDLMTRIVNHDFGRLESLLVLKDGNLILEEYFFGYNRTHLHNIHSCTKSIASLLLGIELEKHQEIKLSTPLFDFFPQYDSLRNPEKAQISLEHVLTMSAGFPTDDIEGLPEYEDQILTILSRPLAAVPGETFAYNNDLSVVAGAVIHQIAGKHADQIAIEQLFNPLGIFHYQWQFVGELPQCHSDLQMLPRDMAKIGQLVLNNGKWNHRQIVPSDWIKKSTSPLIRESEFFNYGYYWWHRSDLNNPWWPEPAGGFETEHEMSLALGFGGQYIMIIKDLNLVIVTTASDYANGPQARSKIPMAIEAIVPLFK